ncbi:MAG TPA: L,D-transpeptidase [Xanthobacteraceae bacterium]|nr:L,D-transpeptidase [Xanthobacteraceae bacterium]
MVDYYPILARAMSAPEAKDPQWRRGVYERARQMLVTQLLARRPATPPAAIAAEQSGLDSAIRRIEAEMSRPARAAMPRGEPSDEADGDIADLTASAPERGPLPTPLRLSGISLLAVAIVAAAIGAGGYMFWVQHVHKASPAPVKSAAPATAPQAPTAAKTATTKLATTKDGDLAPGIDGGAADNDLPYVFRRQPTFYRTLQPVGTIIIDKLQHFLYLIQPNNVALRYGIGLGEQCTELAGLRHVASKAEWPPWQATPDMIERKLAKPGVMPGGPGNPLGARVMELDDGKSRINGTNAPATVGTNVIFGCVRLGNDDVVDLYGRVPNGTAVLVN